MSRRRPSSARRLRATLAAVVASLLVVPAAALAVPDPSLNREMSVATTQACEADASSPACVSDALGDINAARRVEGVRPMVLPAGFTSLSVPDQLLVLANLERRDRGMTVLVLGLSAPLNANALAGARRDTDPVATPWRGDGMSANWAGGYPSTLQADFGWMYDDGVGSPNIDCSALSRSGCWGHRHDILMDFDPPLVMGAALTRGAYGASMAEVFVGGDSATGPGQPDAPLSPTYLQLMGASGSHGGSTSAPVAHPAPTGPGCRVPRVIGLSRSAAIAALRRARCTRATVVSAGPVSGAATVLAQSPRPGVVARSGRVVLHV